ncbi:MAG: ectoine/hydroxyectoine ABC transporter substrate-binding protein EhuB [Pyrinomonadaceae bacterium]|nr:ectoine/hydroxyectoine ABC transporter substrate-binding protein EhuB [Pyrinomonadaceae bacterium]
MKLRKPIKTFLPIAVFAVLSVIAFYFYGSRDVSLSKIRKTKTIKIGYAIEAPYAFLKGNNEVGGQSPDIAKYVAQKLGIEKIEWKQTEFSMLFSDLQQGRIDVVAAGTFITPERAEIVNFSEPIFHVNQGLLVLKGNPRKLNSYGNFVEMPEVKVAVISGSVEERFLRRTGVSDKQIISVPDALTGRVAVEAGNADCLALSSPTVNWMAIKDQLGKTETAQISEQVADLPPGFSGYGAFAFRKKDVALLNEWNAVLKQFVGTEEYKKIVAEYGFTDSELPGNITTAEVLKK